MAGVELQRLSKRFWLNGQPLDAVNGVSARIAHGSFTVIVGRSGCGKTTLLRLLGGLEDITDGKILWTDATRQDSPPKIGFVFQEPRLMPWLTVAENIAFSLSKDLPSSMVAALVDPILKLLGLENFHAAYPSQLSGGMAQRVALGRTLCYKPELILMDEPFGALDYFTRKKLQREMVDLFIAQNKTIIFVTHDVPEAVFMGQKILVMDAGAIVREIPNPLPYPREDTDERLLPLQQEILHALGGG